MLLQFVAACAGEPWLWTTRITTERSNAAAVAVTNKRRVAPRSLRSVPGRPPPCLNFPAAAGPNLSTPSPLPIPARLHRNAGPCSGGLGGTPLQDAAACSTRLVALYHNSHAEIPYASTTDGSPSRTDAQGLWSSNKKHRSGTLTVGRVEDGVAEVYARTIHEIAEVLSVDPASLTPED